MFDHQRVSLSFWMGQHYWTPEVDDLTITFCSIPAIAVSWVSIHHNIFKVWETNIYIIELDDGKIYRTPLYLMVKTMVSCRFTLELTKKKLAHFGSKTGLLQRLDRIVGRLELGGGGPQWAHAACLEEGISQWEWLMFDKYWLMVDKWWLMVNKWLMVMYCKYL